MNDLHNFIITGYYFMLVAIFYVFKWIGIGIAFMIYGVRQHTGMFVLDKVSKTLDKINEEITNYCILR